jgi:hypothetical protein
VGVNLVEFFFAKRGLVMRSLEALQLRGNPEWMSPKVVNQVELGFAFNIWSRICNVLEMAIGNPPWSHVSNPLAMVYQFG